MMINILKGVAAAKGRSMYKERPFIFLFFWGI
jgi:hypothetical protein